MPKQPQRAALAVPGRASLVTQLVLLLGSLLGSRWACPLPVTQAFRRPHWDMVEVLPGTSL